MELDQARREVQEAKTAAEREISQLREQFQNDPAGALKTLGIENPGEYANRLWYAELGDDAPEEFKNKVHQQRTEQRLRELEQLNKETEEKANNARQQAVIDVKVQNMADDIKGLVSDIPADAFPYLRREADANSSEVLKAFGELGETMIAQGQYPTATQMAQLLEQGIAEQISVHSPQQASPPAQDTQSAAPTRKPTTTLSDADTTQKPNEEPEGLLTPEEYRKRGLAALRKYGYKLK